MKTFKLSNSLIVLMVVFAFTSLTYAQADHADNKKVNPDIEKSTPFMINESNYLCFSDINCLKRQKELDVKFGRDFNVSRYTLEGQSKNERVFAEYDKHGKLLNSRLVQVNGRMPAEITKYLASSEYAGWKILGNEKTVVNFNPKTTKYQLVLQNSVNSVVLHFDRHGNLEDPFIGA